MAAVYRNGTLSGTSTQKAKDVHLAWKSAFVSAIAAGKTNWSVADYTVGVTYRTVVSNSLGFAVMIVTDTTLSTNNINVYLGKEYVAGTGLLNASRTSGHSSYNISTNSNGYNTYTVNPTATYSSGTGIGSGANTYVIAYVATTNQDAWTAHIENDWAVLSFNDKSATIPTNGKSIYIGAFNQRTDAGITEIAPYCIIPNYNLNQNCVGGFLTLPLFESKTITTDTIVATAFSSKFVNGVGTSTDRYNLDPTKPLVDYISISRDSTTLQSVSTTYTPEIYGWKRGTLKNVFCSINGANYQDILTIDGKDYMYVGGYGVDNTASYNSRNSIAMWVEKGV